MENGTGTGGCMVSGIASCPAARFVERYTEVFDAPPVSQIASLGYDLTALAIVTDRCGVSVGL